MAAETKSNAVNITFKVQKSLRTKFKAHCKKEKISQTQHLINLMKADLKR